MVEVSPPTVESRRMVPQFKENFFHLKCGWKGLDQNCRSYGVVRESDVRLREKENIIPESSFEVMFHLRKVEIWPMSALDKFIGVMKEIDGKIEDRSRNWSVVNRQSGFIQVPSSWSVVWR